MKNLSKKMADNYDFNKTEKKWQKIWEEKKAFEVSANKSKKKFYCLEMFPYPSGDGLHIGHSLNYTIGDIFARFMRMSGLNVLYPMGYDAFGLPAENAAIKVGVHPKKYTENAINNFIKQQKSLGLSYDWSRVFATCDKEYYLWNQYFFLKFFERGLVYRKKAPVNWCPKCNTVLANEQVHNGKCWRHEDTDVEIKHLEQWFIKTTDYAEELLEDIKNLDWPEKIKTMQKNWIGKSHGTEIDFEIRKPADEISNVVIVHGCPHDKEKSLSPETRTYDKHWIPWIKENLEKKQIDVYAPLMPEPWAPEYSKWKKEFEKLPIDRGSILVGHSCGGAFLVRWLAETKTKIKKLILVSPGKAGKESRESLSNLYGNKKYKNIGEYVEDEIIIFTAEDDYDYHIKSAYEYEKDLPAEIINLGKGFGHFTLKGMGKEEFPELLDEILSYKKFPVFTTRPDTIYGVTFMVLSAQHEKLSWIVTRAQKPEVENFLKKIKSVSKKSIKEADFLEKEGVFTGSYAINPLTNEKIPIYVANFVVADYGSGMVMGVPAHDQRDFEFAKKYKLKIKQVIEPYDKKNILKERAYTGPGKLINSEQFSGLDNERAKEKITEFLIKKGLGRKSVQYKLKDWLISRQRYWGTPIPFVYCDKCGVVPVPEKDLPVVLPKDIRFGEGNPLETNKEFIETKCPKCGGNARRETDTMDTFFDSSWYFLRFADSKNKNEPFSKEKIDYWCPVDLYIGGAEHACMHLIYSRFFTKVLRDMNFLKFKEPFKKLFNQGMLHASDGRKMSKSLGNVINPLEIVREYGADSLRLALVSFASPDSDVNWDEKTLHSSFNFLNKVYKKISNIKIGSSSPRTEHKLNKAIKGISTDITNLKYNLAVIKLRDLFGVLSDEESKEVIESFLKLLSVFCPHIAEELWEMIGGKGLISLSKWPEVDERKINEKFDKQEINLNNLISDINNILKILKEKNEQKNRCFIYVLPNEKEFFRERLNEIRKKTGLLEITLFAVNDSDKYDPENKSKKVKPGKPGIYLE